MRSENLKIFSRDLKVRNYSLYALKLEHGKYYIGLTSYKDANCRIEQHGTRHGAAWTRKHKPVETLEIKKIGKMPKAKAENLENDMANEYVTKYGKRNVRGGRMITTRWLLFREYNPGTNEALLQTVMIFILVVVIVVICFLFHINELIAHACLGPGSAKPLK